MSKHFIIGSCPAHCANNHGRKGAGDKELWGGLMFSPSPTIHETLISAESEAVRLAVISPGKAYIVFEARSYTMLSNTVTGRY